jgi:hypothetical protein
MEYTTETCFRKILKVGNQWEINGKFVGSCGIKKSAPVGLEMVCPVGQVFRATTV